jgi:hypothetical protein
MSYTPKLKTGDIFYETPHVVEYQVFDYDNVHGNYVLSEDRILNQSANSVDSKIEDGTYTQKSIITSGGRRSRSKKSRKSKKRSRKSVRRRRRQ